MARLALSAELVGHEGRAWQASWDRSGEQLATCSGDRSARIWTPVAAARFFSSAQEAAVAELGDGERRTSESWQCIEIIDNAHKRTVRSVAFEPTQGRALATASFDGTTAIWEKEPGADAHECVATLEGHENEAKSVAWSPSGQLLATCGRDKSVWIWESNGEGDFDCISVLMEHTQDVKMVLWHPVDELLASFSYDNTIRIWKDDGDDWCTVATLAGHTSTVWAGAFSPDGRYLASVSDDRTLRIWTRRPERAEEAGGADAGFYCQPSMAYDCIATVPDSAHSRAIYSVSWCGPADGAPAGELGYLATGCGDNAVRVFKVTAVGERLEVALVHTQENAHGLSDVNCVQWNPAHPGWLATCGDDGTVRIWHLES
ncbi:cytosolic iron-sulfur protein assembly [Coemansia biformis]|uniref:Probable cytosolic iron-sulfur protein assembly protein 1 n=1 Tax=Coemansia biformis TaxID=1286918 RepID=A0A9W7YD89_9FUNG|nr:cytosolic iron-sulfur protein assembly [Coemansia biformis]